MAYVPVEATLNSTDRPIGSDGDPRPGSAHRGGWPLVEDPDQVEALKSHPPPADASYRVRVSARLEPGERLNRE